MSELLLLGAGTLSLLLTVIYGFSKNRRKLEYELESARRIRTIAALRTASTSSLKDVLTEILGTLVRVYRAKEGTVEFRGELLDGFSVKVGAENKLPANLVNRIDDAFAQISKRGTESGADAKEKHVTFSMEDREFSCRVELNTDIVLIHNEFWHVQELIREKISQCLLDRMSHALMIALKNAEIPCAVLNGLGKGIYKNNAFLREFHVSDEKELEKVLCELQRSDRDRSTFAFEIDNRKITVKKIDDNLFTVFSPSLVTEAGSIPMPKLKGCFIKHLTI